MVLIREIRVWEVYDSFQKLQSLSWNRGNSSVGLDPPVQWSWWLLSSGWDVRLGALGPLDQKKTKPGLR